MKILRTKEDVQALKNYDRVLVYHKIKKCLVICEFRIYQDKSVLIHTKQKLTILGTAYNISDMVWKLSNNKYVSMSYCNKL